ncbi:MAG: GatB/YqeY domain-containing protein [Bacteroidota bacterium]
MSIANNINDGIKDAMRAKDQVKLATLRAVKSALLLEATKDGSSEVNDEVALKLITKLHKQRKEAADIYKEQGREDLYDEEMAQANVLESFLPEQLSNEKIKAIVQEIISSSGASSMADMGKVMGQATGKMAGKADGKVISGIVRELLSS